MTLTVKAVLTAFVIGALLMLFLVLRGLTDFELSEHVVENHQFDAGANTIDASLVLPANCADPAIAVIVHGDGSQNRWSDSGYLPLINALADECIGVFSWDKPGVGNSTGQWLDQSMSDRAEESYAAWSYVRSLTEVSAERVGYLGFSQAGWVIPEATTFATPAFSVLIGAAVNWREQGHYFTTKDLHREGHDPADAIAMADRELAENDRIFAAANGPAEVKSVGITRQRFHFVHRNYLADARADIAEMHGPVAAIWGSDDLNVDPAKNYDIYRQALSTDSTHLTKLIPRATHGLLRARWFNYQTVDEWSPWSKALFAAMGRRAWAKDSVEMISTWINTTIDR